MFPKVSVILSIYNVEDFLERCIETIVNQTYENLEIILVDDGSKDSSPYICDKWAEKDNRIKVIHKANAGLGMARNTGIDNATGKYIFFIDSDDYVDTSLVEKCVTSAEQYSSDVVIYGRNDVYEDGTIKEKKVLEQKDFFEKDAIINQLLPEMFTYDKGFGVSAWGKMYNLNTIRKLNCRFVSEREIISEDAYFELVFFSKISVASIVRECLYFYYKRINSLSRSFKEDRAEKNNIFLQKMLDYVVRENLPSKVANHITARYHMYMISAAKLILSSDLSKKHKSTEIYKILRDKVWHDSLNSDVVYLHNRSLRVFLKLLKYKWFWLCRVLLWFKIKQKEA